MQTTYNVLDTANVLQQIQDDVRLGGYRFIPIVGAGLSRASGYPIIRQLNDSYLPYCVLRALGLNPVVEGDFPEVDTAHPRWAPRSGVWPNMAVEMAEHWAQQEARGKTPLIRRDRVRKLLERLCNDWATEPIAREFGNKLTFPIAARARESLKDWRTMLGFLSQLVERESSGRRRVALALADAAVVDSFFRYLALDKEPSLAHRMLQALSIILRCDVILSTNFDDFLERAYSAVGVPLAIFEVPLPTALPSPELVLAQRALVKMHGGRFHVRADFTVDAPPDARDLENFFGYLAGRGLSHGEAFQKEGFSENVAVLVSGISGREERTFTLLQFAWEAFSNLHIYWLGTGGTRGELDNLGKHFSSSAPGNRRFIPLGHPDHGLFFLQLFQKLNHSVPTAGVIFPGMWELPTPPVIGPGDDGRLVANFCKTRGQICEALQQQWNHQLRKPLALFMNNGFRGGVGVCSDLFLDTPQLRNLGKPPQDGRPPHDSCNLTARPLWIDLDQIWKPVGLFLRLTLLASKVNGDVDPISALDIDLFDGTELEFETFCEAVISALRVNFANPSQGAERLLLFVNAQEGCGLDSPFVFPAMDLDEVLRQGERGVENAPGGEWEKELGIRRMLALVERINADNSCGVQFLFIVRCPELVGSTSDEPMKRLETLIASNNRILINGLQQGVQNGQWESRSCDAPCSAFNPEQIAEVAIDEWAGTGEDQHMKHTFLYLLTLFRHARYPACLERILCDLASFNSLNSTAALQDSIRDWLQSLERLALLRFKVGGFIWIHPGLKAILRHKLEDKWESRELPWHRESLHLETVLARWYGRLLLATADPLAAVESIYHSLHAIRFVRLDDKLDSENVVAALAAAHHAILVLNLAAPLFDRRLSDMFADHALANLHSLLVESIKRIGKHSHRDHTLKALFSTLIGLTKQLIDIRGNLYVREGEYGRVIGKERRLSPRLIEKDLWHDTNFRIRRRLRRIAAHVHLRHFTLAECQMTKLWNRVLRPLNLKPCHNLDAVMDFLGDGSQCARRWLAAVRNCEKDSSKGSPPGEAEARTAARLARWTLQFQMQRSQIEYLANAAAWGDGEREDREKKRATLAERGLRLYHFGSELLRHASLVSDGFVWEENVRLRAHAALCYAHINTSGSQQIFALAERVLADAEAYVDEFPLKEGGLVRVIAQIRRAEITLIRAGRNAHFQRFRNGLKDIATTISENTDLEYFEPLDSIESGEIQKVAADARDAMVCLEGAGVELQRHPKSRWWWWTYAVLKSKAVEYLYTCRLAGRETNDIWRLHLVPPMATSFFWGGAGTIVQHKQMTDRFFLARILESFSRTALAHVLYHASTDPAQAARRFLRTEPHLRFLLTRLKNQVAIRDTNIQPSVNEYAQSCIMRAENVLKLITGWAKRTVASLQEPIS